MNSRVIKFVAGGGKTTYSEKIIKNNNKCLYLAFTNSVVDALADKGFVSKTIDSLFFGFLMPKFFSLIPLISDGCQTVYVDTKNPNYNLISNIHIGINGDIFNRSKNTGFNLYLDNSSLNSLKYKANLLAVKYIFSKKELRLTDSLASELYLFILNKYKNLITNLIKNRFTCVVIDEAQDLKKGFREEFAKLLYESDIPVLFLGDDNQNINGGGGWFESLKADIKKNRSYRCPEQNCKWIRNNIKGIEIYGNESIGGINLITLESVKEIDDGKTVLLYCQNKGKAKIVLEYWKGPNETIKSAKGRTISKNIVIVAGNINKKNLYTGITRTTQKCYLCIDKII